MPSVSSDCCTQSFFPSVERLNNRLRESLHTNRASLSLALLGRAAVCKHFETSEGRRFNRKLTANFTASYLLKSTFGVALSASDIWKYSLGEKPNIPAINFFGNLLTSWLKTLTLSL